MEEILNHLILVDEECRRTINELQEKKDNIEYLVNEELTSRKDEIKNKYKFKIDMRKNEYEIKLNEEKQQIATGQKQEIENLLNQYNQEKEMVVKQIVESII